MESKESKKVAEWRRQPNMVLKCATKVAQTVGTREKRGQQTADSRGEKSCGFVLPAAHLLPPFLFLFPFPFSLPLPSPVPYTSQLSSAHLK